MRALFSLFIIFYSGLACAIGPCYPKSSVYLPADVIPSAVSKADFENNIDLVEAHYASVVASKFATLKIHRLWKDGTVNAQAYRSGVTWHIDAFGGLARFPGMTSDAYLAVLCHELGHHIGGAPKYDGGSDWASVEGEADYFSTVRCMKELGLSSKRIRNAGLALARALAQMGGESPPSLFTPDNSSVSKTNEEHPDAQCRLDTMVNGNRCGKTGDLSETDPRINTCYDYQTMFGVRPRCWFKP